MLFLKQSTAVTVNIGPFIDDTDGKTAEVGLTEHPADILLAKNGGNFAAKNEASNLTHDNLGWYHCPIDETDTDTLGRLQLHCHEAGFLPVFHEYTVLAANVFDALIGGGDYLDTTVAELANIDFGATMKASLETAVDAGLDNAVPAVNTAGSVNDLLKDQIDVVLDNIHDTDLPDLHTDVGTVNGNIVNMNVNVTDLMTDIGDASASTLGSIYAILGNPAALAIKTSVEDIHTDVGTVASYVDLEVAAIKAITDLLTLGAIADAVLDETTEVGVTLRQSIRLMLAALAGKSSGGGTNDIRFRNQADNTDRIRATVDANGNRTAIATDP